MKGVKLEFGPWLDKYFDKDDDHNYYTSRYEACVIGFAPSDMSRYRDMDLLERYESYLDDTEDFLKYDE